MLLGDDGNQHNVIVSSNCGVVYCCYTGVVLFFFSLSLMVVVIVVVEMYGMVHTSMGFIVSKCAIIVIKFITEVTLMFVVIYLRI